MMIANRTLLAELGLPVDLPVRTWDELLAAGRRIHQASGGAVCALDLEFLAEPAPASVTRYIPWFLNAGEMAPFVDDKTGLVTVDSEPRLAVIELFRQMLADGLCRAGEQTSGFLRRRTVFRMSCQRDGWQYCCDKMPGAALTPLPFPVRREGMVSRTVIRGFFAGILRATAETPAAQDAAWRALKGLLAAETQTVRLRQDHCEPSRTDLGHCVAECGGEVDVFYDYGARFGAPAMDLPGNEEIHRILCQGFRQALLAARSPAAALCHAQQLLQEYVEQDGDGALSGTPAVELYL
jgi:hypothetical protein